MTKPRPSRSQRDQRIASVWAKQGPAVARELIEKQCAAGVELLRQHRLLDSFGNWRYRDDTPAR